MARPLSRPRGSSPRGRRKRERSRRGGAGWRLIPARAGKTRPGRIPDLVVRAHPRAGGENQLTAEARKASGGSSPRGRGKHGNAAVMTVRLGLIPTWAGKTRASSRRRTGTRAHPRMGGENSAFDQPIEVAAGSSPHGRGKRRRVRARTLTARLIPARAGKTNGPAAPTREHWAHPRAGGENDRLGDTRRGPPGSSPRGRGKRNGRDGGSRRTGLIPARAGKTASRWAEVSLRAAHPHAGGENPSPFPWVASPGGSSPRGRGKQWSCEPHSFAVRLIPAWAGKTHRSRFGLGCGWAHPRMGGENVPGEVTDLAAAGSSPHGRGKLGGLGVDVAQLRLIPAWAGKTLSGIFSPSSGWAHPRMGGENLIAAAVAGIGAGSSPHGRGKRSRSESSPPTKAAHPRMGGENLCYKQVTLVSLGSSPHARGKLNGRVDGNLAPGLIPAWAGKTTRSMSAWIIEAAHPRMGGENAPPRAQTVNWMRLIPAWAGKTLGSSISAPTPRAHPRMGGENQ